MAFESLNAADGEEGERRWTEAGRPTVPSLVVDGRSMPVLHVSQIAEALGLPPPAGRSPARDGADAAAILDAWVGHARATDWETLCGPTPSRGRSARNLTVNVFHPFELLPVAWESGEFAWRPEDDDARERRLTDRQRLLAFAEQVAAGWRSFLAEEDLAGRDPLVESPRGRVRFSALLSFQRWHAAYHYRQLVSVLDVGACALDLGGLEDLVLPLDVF